MRSHANLSSIIRTAGCCGVTEVIATGHAKVDARIARDGAAEVVLSVKRSLAPVLKKLKGEGYTMVGLEQATGSVSLHDYAFPRKCVLVIGAEREGITQDCLDLMDAVVEIPVWGLPFSYNAATATSLCLYEYCRQYPTG